MTVFRENFGIKHLQECQIHGMVTYGKQHHGPNHNQTELDIIYSMRAAEKHVSLVLTGQAVISTFVNTM